MLSYLYEVDEMVVLVMRTDGGEEFSEGSMPPDGELPVSHIKSCFSHLLEKGVLGLVILPVDLMGTCLNMYICCPGGDGWLVIFLDVVYLGHPEFILVGIGVELAG